MLINELTDLDCEACGDAVDLTADGVEPFLPLLCERCLCRLIEDDGQMERLAEAA